MHEPHQFFLVVHIQPVETNSQMCNWTEFLMTTSNAFHLIEWLLNENKLKVFKGKKMKHLKFHSVLSDLLRSLHYVQHFNF